MIRVAAETLPEELLALIAQVEAGDVVLLERQGVVVARIVPLASAPPKAAESTDPIAGRAGGTEPSPTPDSDDFEESPLAKELRELRKGVTLGGLDWKALRDEGRR